MWNGHIIRPSRNRNVPSGRPVIMYNAPKLWNAEDYIYPVAPADLETCSNEAEDRSVMPCDIDIFQLCCHILSRDGLEPALDAKAGVDLFIHLKNALTSML